jgi:hypothetical protein
MLIENRFSNPSHPLNPLNPLNPASPFRHHSLGSDGDFVSMLPPEVQLVVALAILGFIGVLTITLIVLGIWVNKKKKENR